MRIFSSESIRLVFLWILLVAGFTIILMALAIGAEARTIIVDHDGNGDYVRIQDALDDSEKGDKIRVREGIYYEQVVVNKSVSLIGNGWANTIIDGQMQEGDVVRINANEVTMSGFTVRGSGNQSTNSGIYIRGDYHHIFQNRLLENRNGARLYYCYGNNISNNIFESNNGTGLALIRSRQNFLENNSCLSNNRSGIALIDDSAYNQLNNNTCINNDDGISLSISHRNFLFNNTCRNIEYGLNLDHSSFNTIGYNNFTENRDGLRLFYSSDNRIFRNYCTINSAYGMYVVNSDYNEIVDNVISYNFRGLSIDESDKNIVKHNDCSYNDEMGVRFHDHCRNNTVNSNIISNNGKYGIYLYDANRNNTIRNNEIVNNGEYGIEAHNHSKVINATNNWWGHESGPYHAVKNPTGEGNAITDIVDFSPWLLRAPDDPKIGFVDDNAVVGGNGSLDWPYNIIQNAVDSALDGDIIRVFEGVYQENLIINISVSLIGNGSTNTTIYGNGTGDVILVTSNSVNISGFKVTNSGDVPGDAGIKLTSDHNAVMDNNCSYNRNGIYPKESSNNTIEHNICSNNTLHGITFGYSDSKNNTLKNNTCDFNEGYGIYIGNSENNYLSGNSFSFNDGYGMNISYSSGNTLLNNTCINNRLSGIHFRGSPENVVMGNLIINNTKYGISLESSLENVIYSNIIGENGIGIYLELLSENNFAYNNEIVNNSEYGVDARANSGHQVFATNNWWGNNSGPYHEAENPEGTGDRISDNVLFDPWIIREKEPPVKDNLSVVYVEDDAPPGGNGSKERPFTEIQEGVDGVMEGGTVIVMSGTYYENIILNKTIQLLGDDNGSAIIDGGYNGNVIIMRGYGSSIENLTITHSNQVIPGSSGILVEAPCRIVNNTIFETRNAILVQFQQVNGTGEGEIIHIKGNFLYDNRWGVNLQSNTSSLVEHNEIGHNIDGIQIYGSNGNLIQHNAMYNNSYGIEVHGSSDNRIVNNSCTNNIRVGIELNESLDTLVIQNNFSNNSENGVKIDLCANCSVENNKITGNQHSGIDLDRSSSITITGNLVVDNDAYAIIINTSSNISLANNSLLNCTNGIRLNGSEDNMITDNLVAHNKRYGLALENSSNISVVGNELSHNGVGILVANGSLCIVVHHNFIFSNTEFGINGSQNDNQIVYAGMNFWGSNSGPYHPMENPMGKGDNITNYVTFKPWLDEDGKVHEEGNHVGGEGNDQVLLVVLLAILIITIFMFSSLILSIFDVHVVDEVLYRWHHRFRR